MHVQREQSSALDPSFNDATTQRLQYPHRLKHVPRLPFARKAFLLAIAYVLLAKLARLDARDPSLKLAMTSERLLKKLWIVERQINARTVVVFKNYKKFTESKKIDWNT